MSPPPWLKTVQELTTKYPRECTQVLATLTHDHKPSSRYVVHRKLFLPDQLSETPLFISTTDVRSTKSTEITQVSPSVHISWWLPTTNTQFRIEGTAKIVGGQADPAQGVTTDDDRAEWEGLRKEIWAGMRGEMRASFARPVAPGSKLEGGYEQMDDWPKTLPELNNAKDEVQRQQIIFAYSNFSLVIVKPLALDFVELNVVPNRRTTWTLVDGEWVTQILCP